MKSTRQLGDPPSLCFQVGQDKLTSWLDNIGDGRMLTEDSPDVSLIPIGAAGGQSETIYLASTTDFFSPISLDPYNQGRIACANTLSDLYAIGAHRVDTMLMILSVSTKMEEEHRDIVTRKMIEGFNDACKEAGTKVSGGQTVFNPWPILGGCASTTLIEHEIIRADALQSGDVLVLTKPLGSQIAANLALWLGDEKKWQKASAVIDLDTALQAVQSLVLSFKVGTFFVMEKRHTDVLSYGGVTSHLQIFLCCNAMSCLSTLLFSTSTLRWRSFVCALSSGNLGAGFMCFPPKRENPLYLEGKQLL